MAKRILSLQVTLPPPRNAGEAAIHRAIQQIVRVLVDRTESMIDEGLFAARPTANGTKRFYFATDTNALYYDDGAWNAI